jgi:hypothetical protein
MLIVPIFIAIIALAILLTVLALTIALKTANIAANASPQAGNPKQVKALMVGAGIITFFISWYAMGPIDTEAFMSGLTYIWKATFAALAAAIVMGVAAIISRAFVFFKYQRNQNSQETHTSVIAVISCGLAIGAITAVLIGNSIGPLYSPPKDRTLENSHPAHSRPDPNAPKRHHYDPSTRPQNMPSETHYAKGDLTRILSAPDPSSKVLWTLNQRNCLAVTSRPTDKFYEVKIWGQQNTVLTGYVEKLKVRKLRQNQGCSR